MPREPIERSSSDVTGRPSGLAPPDAPRADSAPVDSAPVDSAPVDSVAPDSLSLQSDWQLLQGFVSSGDAEAFRLLVRRHERIVFRVCRRILADSHDAEDAF